MCNMTTLSVNLPDDIYDEFISISEELKISPDACALLAISYMTQTDVFQTAIEGMHRYNDGQALKEIPEIEEELEVGLHLHPQAQEELESLDEESQINILAELIERTTLDEEDLEDTLDLVIKDSGEAQVVLSSFEFGDVVYEVGDEITIYHISLSEEEEEEDEDDSEEDDDFEEEDAYEDDEDEDDEDEDDEYEEDEYRDDEVAEDEDFGDFEDEEEVEEDEGLPRH